jgi:hypothetical protein
MDEFCGKLFDWMYCRSHRIFVRILFRDGEVRYEKTILFIRSISDDGSVSVY